MSIFAKIIAREIPANIVYEDDLCLAFDDIHPQAPVHILLIPKQPIASIDDIDSSHQKLMGHLLCTVTTISQQLKLNNGYRLVINNGQDGGQEVPHLHIHILAGRPMQWPPG